MQIVIEELITRVVREIIKELKNQDITVLCNTSPPGIRSESSDLSVKSETIDMSKFRTPVLTENHIQRLNALTGTIIIPTGTIITPKARELIADKQLKVITNVPPDVKKNMK